MRIARVILFTLILLCLQFIPFIVIGETWGMVWFLINMPLSGMVENTIGIGHSTTYLILSISILNSLLIASIVDMLLRTAKKFRQRSENGTEVSSENDPIKRV